MMRDSFGWRVICKRRDFFWGNNSVRKEIGLKNSIFTNSTGWPDPEHLTTVDDLLTLSIRTIKDFPEFFHFYSEKEFKYNGIKQFNRNPLLFTDLNSDGLKTGHTSLGGYDWLQQ